MSELSDLHARLRGVIEERLALAKAATPGPWYAEVDPEASPSVWVDRGAELGFDTDRPEDAAFIAAHDPADAIRRHEAALRQLERHWQDPECTVIDCLEVEELAASYGVPVESEANDA